MLRGRVRVDGEWVFRTQLAEAYPPALGAKYGELMAKALGEREQALISRCPVPTAPGSEGYRLSGLLAQVLEDT